MAGALKNVVVFTVREQGYAIELGWIREVFTLGYVTPVPHASKAIAGVVNFRGIILSVIDLRGLDGNAPQAYEGDSSLLLEVDRIQVALRVGTIDEVTSLAPSDVEHCLKDTRNRDVKLLFPPDVFDSILHPDLHSRAQP